ncbi:pseudouridine synthase [Acaromyces ingoldii]|uniref:tRNA pseudouridine(55) synthase n=1 Tax=Acaromyces ingoldii TaxID=215250 RepID=A0A316YV47_9BASI|nr:pseudouridine synthase [Acaromyces ingoldii]PWN92654.1 pseudouridine synthase [Acaromyces ingoldii]
MGEEETRGAGSLAQSEKGEERKVGQSAATGAEEGVREAEEGAKEAGQATAAEGEHGKRPLEMRALPLSGLIGIVKPPCMTSMVVLDTLKPLLASSRLFQLPPPPPDEGSVSRKRKRRDAHMRAKGMDLDVRCPKVGQGGTLDPLAEGVLVVGIGAATKKLSQFLECTKDYRAIGLLGTTTASYDSDEPVLARRPHAHVTKHTIEEALERFRGAQKQLPPLYSAIRIDGKRLFDYAREGKDPPRKVEPRDVTISSLTLTRFMDAGTHEYREPAQECSAEEKALAERARRMAGLDEGVTGATRQGGEEAGKGESEAGSAPAAFEIDMSVSSGTYVRSVVHDVGQACGSAAHVVKLVRTRQGAWVTPGHVTGDDCRVALDFALFDQAAKRLAAAKQQQRRQQGGEEPLEDGDEGEPLDEQGLAAWERALVDRMEAV